jgi:hypothetical protein
LKAQLNPNKIRNLTQNNHIVNHHQSHCRVTNFGFRDCFAQFLDTFCLKTNLGTMWISGSGLHLASNCWVGFWVWVFVSGSLLGGSYTPRRMLGQHWSLFFTPFLRDGEQGEWGFKIPQDGLY